MPPTSSSGHFQRHLNHVYGLGKDAQGFCELKVPGHLKTDASRCVHKVHAFAPHEELAAEIEENPGLDDALRDSIQRREWPESYWTHP
eukprot:5326577-Alexandrium_andersonii.AAC.1